MSNPFPPPFVVCPGEDGQVPSSECTAEYEAEHQEAMNEAMATLARKMQAYRTTYNQVIEACSGAPECIANAKATLADLAKDAADDFASAKSDADAKYKQAVLDNCCS